MLMLPFVSWLTEIKLKLNDGTQSTSVRVNVDEILIVPMCVTMACFPLGKDT